MASVNNRQKTVATDLGDLLDAGDGTMVTLVAGDTQLVAHKAVLAARSPVFQAMFSQDTLEARSGQVTIPDVEGPVLRQLLAYLYTLRAPQLPGMASQLLCAADKYGVAGLKAECEKDLVSQLTVENAAVTAVLAVRHSCPSLTQAAVNFIKVHSQVMATQGWADVVLNQPKDVVKVSQLLAAAPGGSSTPVAAGTTHYQSSSDRIQTAATSALPTASCQTPPDDDDDVSRMRSLTSTEKGRRLIAAATKGDVNEMKKILLAGASLDARGDRYWSGLHYAADEGHLKAVKFLLDCGANLDAVDRFNWTPLHVAVSKGHTGVVWLLVAFSADPNTSLHSGYTPLHSAVSDGNAELVRALLEAGANRDARNNNGLTPLEMARRWHKHLTEILE